MPAMIPAAGKVQGPSKVSPESKSSFNPVHVFLHFRTFGFNVLQLILSSKLSELEQFENFAANNQFRKQNRPKMIPKSN